MTAVALPPAPPSATARRSCPFQGLLPYSPEDWEWFFGRDWDARLISENLLAYELTIVYGPSGVGKSSVLSAGVMAELRREAERERQLGRVPFVSVIHGQWQTDPVGSLVTSISDAIRDQAGLLAPPMPAGSRLDERLSSWSRALGAKLYVVLDQFEEYFLYHPRADDPVTIELGEAIAALEDGTNFLISMREDALARLDRFEGIVPGLFDITYRIDPLDRAAAREAITGPRDRYNEAHPDDPVTIEEDLIEEVLDKVRVGFAGQQEATAVDGGREDAVEAAQLQLVFERLWKSEIGAGRRSLRLATLHEMGGAEDVIRSHLVESMARLGAHDQRVAASVFSRLVTPSGAKVALSVDDLAAYADVSPSEMLTLLERLAAGDLRLLRPVAPAPEQPDVPRFEIYHDVLGRPIQEWTGGRELDQARAEAHKERRRRIAATGLSVILVALMAVAGALWLRSERQQRALEASTLATEASVLAARARNQIAQDPAAAVELALRAVDKAKSPSAVQALRESMAELDVEAVLSGHTAGVDAVAVAHDDNLVLTAGADGTARLWDGQDGTLLHALTGHVGPVLAAAFTDDGTTAITAGEDGTIRLWDATTGDADGTLATDLGEVWGFTLAPGGATLAAWGAAPVVEVWNLDDATRVTKLDHGATGATSAAVFGQRAGRSFLATGDSKGVVRIWDTDTWREEARWSELLWINSLDVANDGAWVVIGSGYINGYVWDWQETPRGSSYEGLFRLTFAHSSPGGLTKVSVSPDDEHIVTIGDRTAALWSVDDLRETFAESSFAFDPLVLRGHTGFLTAVVWSKDGTRVATADQDGQIRMWDGWTGSFLDRFAGHRGAVSALTFAEDGRLVSAAEDRTARIWGSFEDRVFRGHENWVNAVAIDEEHDLMVSAGADGHVVGHRLSDATLPLWTIDQGQYGALGFLTAVAISDDGRYVAAGGSDQEVHIWDVGGGTPTFVTVWTPPGAVTDLAFDPNRERLAVGVATGAVHLWSWTHPDEAIPSLIGHRNWVKVAFSHDGDRIVTGGGEGTVRLWDADTGEQVGQPATHDGGVFGVAFTGDDDREVVSGGSDRRVVITDLATGDKRELVAHAHPITSVAVDATGARIVSGDAGGYVAVWKAATGELLTLGHKHELYVNQIRLGKDGTIYSAGDDDVVRGYACGSCADSTDDLIAMARNQLRWLRRPSPILPVLTIGAEIATGTCTTDPGSDFTRAQPVACTEPHAYEFFAAFELPDPVDADYPGGPELQDRTDRLCGERAITLGDAIPAGLIVSSYKSDEKAWEADARHVQCVFQLESGGEWVGSVLEGTATVPRG